MADTVRIGRAGDRKRLSTRAVPAVSSAAHSARDRAVSVMSSAGERRATEGCPYSRRRPRRGERVPSAVRGRAYEVVEPRRKEAARRARLVRPPHAVSRQRQLGAGRRRVLPSVSGWRGRRRRAGILAGGGRTHSTPASTATATTSTAPSAPRSPGRTSASSVSSRALARGGGRPRWPARRLQRALLIDPYDQSTSPLAAASVVPPAVSRDRAAVGDVGHRVAPAPAMARALARAAAAEPSREPADLRRA